MDALEKLRQRNRLHVVLRSGLAVAYHLPDVERHLADTLELDISQMRRSVECKLRIIAEMLDVIEGEPITSRDDRRAIVAALTPDERAELYDLAAPTQPEEPTFEPERDLQGRSAPAWLETIGS